MIANEYLRKAGRILKDIKPLAIKYYSSTGRPLGVTGEIAEYEAIRLLKLDVAEVRQEGYDAIRTVKKKKQRIQIKGKYIPNKERGQKLGGIRLDRKWDFIFLVILDRNYKTIGIYEANRRKVRKALKVPGSKARNIRGQLGISKFKKISNLIWP
jgi:hypothetical protein